MVPLLLLLPTLGKHSCSNMVLMSTLSNSSHYISSSNMLMILRAEAWAAVAVGAGWTVLL